MRKVVLSFALLFFSLIIIATAASGATVFGPKQYLRTGGGTDIYTDIFSAAPSTAKLVVKNGEYTGGKRVDFGVSSARIYLNGDEILSPSDFKQTVYLIEAPINLLSDNTLSIELNSSPDSYITVEIISDTSAPMVSLTADPENIEAGAASTLYWSSANADTVEIDNGIGAVDTNGSVVVSPSTTTTYTVTATGPGGSATDMATVTILPPAPVLTTIEVSPTSEVITTEETRLFTAEGKDQFGDPIETNVTWSVNEGGSIDATGLFTPAVVGTFTITAQDGNISGTATITVTLPPSVLTSIEIDPELASITTEETQQFTATGIDQYGNPISTTITWSVSGDGSIDSTGFFEPVSTGTFTVTAQDGTISDTATIIVTLPPPVLTTIDVTPLTANITTDETQQFTAAGKDQYGNPIATDIAWSVDGGGTIDSIGLFTPTATGTFTVTAQDGGVSGTATVTVIETPVLTTIEVTPSDVTITTEQTQQFTAVGKDQYGNEIPTSVTWSISDRLSISSTGLFTPMITGTFTVTAQDGGVSGTATVTVIELPVLTTIEVTPSDVTITTEQTQQFTAVGKDQYGNEIPTSVTWSISDRLSISSTGLFTPMITGTFTVTAQDGGVSGTATVTVIELPVLTTIEVTPSDVTITTEQTQQFTAVGKDQYGNEIPTSVTWSISDRLSISSSGLFTPMITGTFTVTAQDGGVSGSATVTVIELPVLTTIEVIPATADIFTNETQQFIATGKDQYGDPIAITVTWSVNGGGTIDSDGLLTATSPGTYIVSAQDGIVSGNATINITDPPVLTNIEVIPAVANITTEETQQFAVLGKDQYGDPIATSVTWSVNGGGTIDSTGLFTPSSTGIFIVTAQDGDISGTASIEIELPPEPPTVNFSVSPPTINYTESATLTWQTTNAISVFIDNSIGEVDLNGSIEVSPVETTTYNISVSGPGGNSAKDVTVTVVYIEPKINFSVTDSEITHPGSTTLSWDVQYCDSVFINNGIGQVTSNSSLTVSPNYTTTYYLTATSKGQTFSARATVKVLGNPPAPLPEGSFGEKYQGLVPQDASFAAYDEDRFMILTGLVSDTNGDPVQDVGVEIFQHPEYGTALTDSTGRFEIPVEGGSLLKVVFTKNGYITLHRNTETSLNDIVILDPVILTQQDVETIINFDGDPGNIQIHKSTEIVDIEFGNRSCTMVFTGDNIAYEVDENGNEIQELTNVTVRATEFTSPESMPSVLPPNSAFTYCTEFSVDNVQRVKFEKPVVAFVDNFLGFEVGGIVPVGYYDRDKGEWIPSKNGVVVELLDANSDGIVDGLDATGDDIADDLNENGLTTDEVVGLDDPATYTPGKTYWRFSAAHFTPWDCNWPYIPPYDAIEPDPLYEPTVEEGELTPLCFASGTKIHTANGLKSIEMIKPGEYVLSQHEDSHTASLKKVTNIFTTPNKSVLKLEIDNSDGNIETLYPTAEHPFWVRNHGWVSAIDIIPDDEIYALGDNWVKVISIEEQSSKVMVYNLEVENFHTYFVGNGGLWVHNTCNGRIEPRNGILHENIPIPGTNISLHYSSEQTEGYKRLITVPVNGSSVPASLEKILVRVKVAGRTFSQDLDPLPNQKVVFEWDGLDYLGNMTNFIAKAKTEIGFVYKAVYAEPSEFGDAFARAGTNVTGIRARQEVTSWKESYIDINLPMKKNTIASGWTISSHHEHFSDFRNLYKGDGTKIAKNDLIITTIAGNGSEGYAGDGGPATDAMLYFPHDVVVDRTGDIYVVDTGNNRIRRIDSQGTITSIAGTGASGYNGDGILATEATLNHPEDIAIDKSGNIYIADHMNNRIRKIDTTGIITTIAGTGTEGFSGDDGPAIEATMDQPNGISIDASGNLYFVDVGSNRVRRIDPIGIITTVAGSDATFGTGDGGPATEARFGGIGDIAIDDAGNLYISDFIWNTIRKVDTSGVITTFAGVSGSGAFSGDSGPATEAKFDQPRGITLDKSGNLYISDMNNQRIRKIGPTGIIITVAGTGIAGFSGDGGPPTVANLRYPMSITVDASGRLYVADSINHRIRRINFDQYNNFLTADEILFAEGSGVGHVMSSIGNHLRTIDLATQRSLLEFTYDGNKLIYMTDQFNNRIEIKWVDEKPTEIISPFGISTLLSVNSNNHLERVTFADSSFFRFEYTAEGLMEHEYDPKNNHFHHTFNTDGRLTDDYDDAGGHLNLTQVKELNGDTVTTLTTNEGNWITHTDKSGSSGGGTSITTDSAGGYSEYTRSADELTDIINVPCISETQYIYGLDPEYLTKFIQFSTETTPSGLTREAETLKEYQDTNGDEVIDLIANTFRVDGKDTTIEHNVLTSTKIITSPEGRIITSIYDPNTLHVHSVEIDGLLPVNYDYYSDGRLQHVATGARQTAYTYIGGNLDTITDPDGNITTFTDYDLLGRVGTITRSDLTQIKFLYDKNGNMTVMTTHTNPVNVNHNFGYNAVNQKNSYLTPLSGEYSYVYDTEGRLTNVYYPSNASTPTIVYDYINPMDSNDKSLLRRIQTPDGNIQYSYYTCGVQLESVTKGTEAITYDYDGTLLTAETITGTLNETLSYIFTNDASDNDFMVDGFTYAGGTENYIYDDDGLLINASAFSIGRNTQNGLPDSVSDNVFNLARSFNGYGETNNESYEVSGSTNLYSWNIIERDNSGRIKEKVETINGVSENFKYTYNPMGRLLTVHKDNVLVEEYSYEKDGQPYSLCSFEKNTLRGIDPGRPLTYDNEDRLLDIDNESITYNYSDDGFLTIKTEGTDVTDYVYSSRGELLSVQLPDSTLIEYLHDPLGRRIAKKVNGTITEKYLWEGRTRLLAMYDGSDTLLMRFEYADGRMPVKMNKFGTDYYLTYDQVGTLRLITDVAGNIQKSLTYDTFGYIISDSNPSFEVPFGFAGGLHDRDTGLVRFGHRDYSPEIRRWTAKDPIFFDGGDTDLYGYCLFDPVNAIDPDGLHERDYWHIHSKKKNARSYAITIPFIGPVIYYSPYEAKTPIEQESIDYHELLHKKYGPFMTEKKVWQKEIEFIRNQLKSTDKNDPNRKILEKWLDTNEYRYKEKYGQCP